jgi:hypothetical protein
LRYLKALTFFGKHDLAFGFNRPERSEIWKTFLGPLMALTVDTLLAAMRTVRALPRAWRGHLSAALFQIQLRYGGPNWSLLISGTGCLGYSGQLN